MEGKGQWKPELASESEEDVRIARVFYDLHILLIYH